MDAYLIWWIIIFIAVSVIEVHTQQLVAIWFSIGSFIAVFVNFFGFDIGTQLIVFILVSIISMLAFRPTIKKYYKPKNTKTNLDLIIGQTGYVIEDFNSLTNEGRVQLQGMDWAAVALLNEDLKKGDKVEVKSVQGVKLFVKMKKTDE